MCEQAGCTDQTSPKLKSKFGIQLKKEYILSIQIQFN